MRESADQIALADLTPEERAAYRAANGVLQDCAQTRPRPLCRAPECLTPLPPHEWRDARKKLCAKSAKQGGGLSAVPSPRKRGEGEPTPQDRSPGLAPL